MKKLLATFVVCLLAVPAMAFYPDGYSPTWPSVTDGEGYRYHDDIALQCGAPNEAGIQICRSQDDSAYLAVAENGELSIQEWEKINQDLNGEDIDKLLPHKKKDRGSAKKKNAPKVHLNGTTICEFESSNREPVLLTKIEYFGEKARVEERMMKIVPGKGIMVMGRSYDSNPEHARDIQEQMNIELANTQEGKETFVLIDPSIFEESDLHLLCSEPFPEEE